MRASAVWMMLVYWMSQTFLMADLQFVGVNLSGAEFGSAIPGTYNVDYTYPTQSEVNYFQSKGMNIVRLPFRWERLQRTLNGSFDATELGRLNTFVSNATATGCFVILDPHNYARYNNNVIGSAQVPITAFSDLWSRLATNYRTNQRVIFGLMNEPNNMVTETWAAAAQAAVTAIRNAGATNLILVPGNAWTGAHSWEENWYGTPNSVAMAGITDPATNFAYEVHQYLDSDYSGSTTNIVSPTIGVETLLGFTAWLQANNAKGLLGEFAVANSTIGPGQLGSEALTNMLTYMATNSDVWLGWTWWSAGPWWGEYMFTLEPKNLGQPTQTDRPALSVLKAFIPIPSPILTLVSPTQVQFLAQPGFAYQPQILTNLVTDSWMNYLSTISGNGSKAFAIGGTGDQAFYRLSVTRLP